MKRRSKQTKTASKPTAEPVELRMRDAVIQVRAAEGDAPAAVSMSVSSEEPVLTYTYYNDNYQRVYEILDHAEGSVDMSRAKDGLVILDRHYGDQIGLMGVELANRKMGGPVRFGSGERAQEISRDAAAGIRRNVSVGYLVDVSSYRLEGDQDGVPVVRAMSWTPYEASFEPVPADTTVGVGRSADTGAAPKAVEIREKNMDPKDMAKLFARAAKFGIEAAKVEALLADGKGRAELDAMIVEKQAEEVEATRKENIELKARKPEVAPDATNPGPIGGDAKTEEGILRKYSVMNILRQRCGMKSDIGLEMEVSDELAKQRGQAARGIIVPHAALCKRDFTVSGTSSYSVSTDLMASEFIDLLRTRSVLGAAGVRFLTGLVGNIAIPKMTAGVTGYWVSEASDITEDEPTLGQVTGTPHTCGCLTDISRRLILQSTPSAEMLVRDEIVERIIRTIQIAVFAGTGAGGQPSAITNATGINNPSVTQGTPTYAEILSFPGDIMADNAEATGQQWIMTAEVWAKLAATDKSTSTAQFVLDPVTKNCIGFPYHVTEDVPANSLWFGNWASVMVGVWGNGIDINVDTATLSASGGVRIVGLQDVDVMVRLGQALAYNTAVTS